MPVEIKELHIKVVVNQTENASTTSNTKFGPGAVQGPSIIDRESLIAECVEQIMKIIQSQKER